MCLHSNDPGDLKPGTSETRRNRGETHNSMRTTSPKTYVSEFHHGLVHKPLAKKDATNIPGTKAAFDKEWDKLKLSPSEKSSTSEEGQKICSIRIPHGPLPFRYSKLENHLQTHRGRVVQGGRWIQCSIPGARSFSFANGSSNIPGYNVQNPLHCWRGQRCNISFNTQVHLSEALRLLRQPEKECPQAWRYGHPFAGLLWERKSKKNFSNKNWKKVPTWECPYVHRKSQRFLSVYENDKMMVGKTEHGTHVESSAKRNLSGRSGHLLVCIYIWIAPRETQKLITLLFQPYSDE